MPMQLQKYVPSVFPVPDFENDGASHTGSGDVSRAASVMGSDDSFDDGSNDSHTMVRGTKR